MMSTRIHSVICNLAKYSHLPHIAERWDLLTVFEVKGCSEGPCAVAVEQFISLTQEMSFSTMRITLLGISCNKSSGYLSFSAQIAPD